MKLLFLFLDGIGLAEDNSETNPFAKANMPYLESLLGNKKLIQSSVPIDNDQVTLLSVDPNLGVKGLPQSATGQAVLLTGINIPAELGYHYGPKPNPEAAKYLETNTIFHKVLNANKKTALLNAYPPRYFDGIDSGKRLYSSIPLALTNAGISLFTHEDYFAGKALSADFTGQGWHDFLNFPNAPLFDSHTAGVKLAELAKQYDFSFFEYWASDYAGHKQNMDSAVQQLETFDGVLKGLLSLWKNEDGLILLTSDHGNMEDLSTRKHTANHVPLLLFGDKQLRSEFNKIKQLTEIAPAIAKVLNI
ncbi:MAG: phosphoglycerate mutase family protein [Chloroflexi bacterium OLB14]|nr:MAG: phosphoglycerate mutase family protein [Chloroflexi bacterium OLB14]